MKIEDTEELKQFKNQTARVYYYTSLSREEVNELFVNFNPDKSEIESFGDKIITLNKKGHDYSLIETIFLVSDTKENQEDVVITGESLEEFLIEQSKEEYLRIELLINSNTYYIKAIDKNEYNTIISIKRKIDEITEDKAIYFGRKGFINTCKYLYECFWLRKIEKKLISVIKHRLILE